MTQLFGLILMFAGVLFGIWAGVWWAFVGGIVDVIEAIRAPELSAMAVAVGLTKFFFSGFIGYVAGAFLFLPGMALVSKP